MSAVKYLKRKDAEAHVHSYLNEQGHKCSKSWVTKRFSQKTETAHDFGEGSFCPPMWFPVVLVSVAKYPRWGYVIEYLNEAALRAFEQVPQGQKEAKEFTADQVFKPY